MQRKIRNVFEYKDYRLLLNDDFLARSAGNHSYSLRAYSRDINLSPSFISDVLRGKRDLSSKKARATFERLGFKLAELDYVENLITFKCAKDPAQKQVSLEAINRMYDKPKFMHDEEKDLILKSVDHMIVHGIVGGEPDYQRYSEICQRMGMSAARVAEITAEFLENGYFKKVSGQYFIEHLNLNVSNSEKILRTQKEFVNRLISLTEASGGMKMPEKMGHYLVFGLDKETMQLFEQAYRHMINTISRLSNQTPVAEIYGFYSSSFYSVKTKTTDF